MAVRRRGWMMAMCGLEELAELLRVLGHTARLTILLSLTGGERSVSDIADTTGLVQPALSQQLALLRKVSLVSTRREAKQIFYAIDPAVIELVRDLLNQLAPVGRNGEGDVPDPAMDAEAQVGAALFARLGEQSARR